LAALPFSIIRSLLTGSPPDKDALSADDAITATALILSLSAIAALLASPKGRARTYR